MNKRPEENPGFSQSDIKYVFFRVALKKCQCCGKNLVFENRDAKDRGAWHAHHIFPLSEGIDNSRENIAVLCINKQDCHHKCAHGGNNKTHFLPQDWCRSHLKRRCWFQSSNDKQCLIRFQCKNRRAYCGRHRD